MWNDDLCRLIMRFQQEICSEIFLSYQHSGSSGLSFSGAWTVYHAKDECVSWIYLCLWYEDVYKRQDNGIKAIWNFAHTDLDAPEDVIVENVHLSESLMALSYNLSLIHICIIHNPYTDNFQGKNSCSHWCAK